MVSTLGRRASFQVAAAVTGVALWTSGAPSVTYPLYGEQWHLTPAVTTAIFAVYPAVLVAVLVVAGDLSDHIGRRKAILLGLGANLVGTLLFAVAPDVGWVFVGRAFMGVGVGLSMSPSTAAMVEFSPAGQAKRASSTTTASTAAGLVLATLVGGALIEYAPFPTHLNFWVLTVVITAVLGAAWLLPRESPTGAAGPWRPRIPFIPKGLGVLFATAALAVTAAYASGALMLSLGANIAQGLIGSDNALVNGSVIALSAAVIGLVALWAKGFSSRAVIVAGGVATAVGMALLVLSSAEHSLALLVLASIGSGAGYSLLFLGGLTLISTHAPAHHRGGALSAVYLVGYLMQGVVAIGLGLLATSSGLRFAIDVGGPAVTLLGLAALVLVVATGRTPAPVREPAVAR
ncbi:MFS transporter [Umezawaea sp. Da 62-37]|uniref:MFS transporter n=1 Tax=Umezawaea sp. Da 62-37 TaxID=3075927 RepID=UPI0028F72C90|nr:MFS transporter [Umezawaea sp. Da 62-37]WNV88915.1 MFS transporter [Umezawaea sp. Da 62-37]